MPPDQLMEFQSGGPGFEQDEADGVCVPFGGVSLVSGSERHDYSPRNVTASLSPMSSPGPQLHSSAWRSARGGYAEIHGRRFPSCRGHGLIGLPLGADDADAEMFDFVEPLFSLIHPSYEIVAGSRRRGGDVALARPLVPPENLRRAVSASELSLFFIYQDLPGLPMALRVSGRLTVLPTS